MAHTTSEKVKKLLVEHLGVDEAKVTDSALLADDLGADSLDTYELVGALDDEFDIDIPDSEVRDDLTVADVVKLVESRL